MYIPVLQRIFAGDALLRRMIRLGLLLESEKKFAGKRSSLRPYVLVGGDRFVD